MNGAKLIWVMLTTDTNERPSLISKYFSLIWNYSSASINKLYTILFFKILFYLYAYFGKKNIRVSFKILSQTLIWQHKNNPLCTWISQPWSRHSCRSQSMPSEHLLTFWHHLQSKLSSWLRQVKQSLAILQAV